jgi:predicted nucleotidyltransferase
VKILKIAMWIFWCILKKGASLLDESGLDIELRELLGCEVDIISDREIRSEFRSFILKEAEAL